jgi:site-specific recombinase XerD
MFAEKEVVLMAKGRKTFRKVITSPELIEQINPKNKKLADRFLKNFATKRSPNSVVSYRSNLNIFFCWNVLENDNRFFIDIKKRELMDFFDYCVTELHHSPNRYAQLHSCLSSFSSWVENFYDEDYPMFRNLLPKIEKPVKENVRKKTVLQKEDIDKLFVYFEENDMTQDACLLALAISCGARVSELASFTTDLIDENNVVFDGLFLETTREIKIKGRGVNGKMLRKYILKDMFLPYYYKWLELRKEIMEEHSQDHDFIFVTKDGTPANADRLRDWMSKWSDVVGQPCYPHNFRHYHISFLKKLELEDDFIVYLTGWSESTGHSMVAIYNDLTAKDRKWKNLDRLKAAMGA